MAVPRGAIGRTFTQSYRDANRLIRVLWGAILIESVILFGSGWVADFASSLLASPLGKPLASTLVSIGAIWLAAPYIVAQYRFIMLDEVERWPEKYRGSNGVRLFFAWSAVVAFVTFPMALAAGQVERLVNAAPLMGLVLVGVAIGFLIFTVRIITLLPAAALGGPATLWRALRESKGHFWFIFIAALLPPASIIVPAGIVAATFRLYLPFLADVVAFAGTMGAGLLGLSAASRIYQMLASGPEAAWPGITTPQS